MQWQVASLFASPVFKLTMDDAEKARSFFEEHILPKANDEICDTQGELSHYHSQNNIFKIYPELQWLEQQLEEAAQLVYHDLMNYSKSGPPRIINAWFNLCGVGGIQPMHNHANCLLCGTFYLHADEHSKIMFEHPQSSSSSHAEIYDAPDDTPNKHGLRFHNREAQIDVQTGDCLFWPSQIKHGYPANKTPGRLTLSFNLMPERLNLDYQINPNTQP